MAKRALLVGINEYDNVTPLQGCVRDVQELRKLLSRNADGSVDFDCQTLTSPGSGQPITRALLRQKWRDLFADFVGDVLFYFSGHGTPTDTGGYLVTQDASKDDWGLAMNDLVILANESRARSVLLILDCCYSGELGNLPSSSEAQALLREGVTILSASLAKQSAQEIGGHGVFTELLIGALDGGAADIRGKVSAASIYAYVEAALGSWDQRPMYKSHASCLDPVRMSEPLVPDALLRELPKLFPAADYDYQMDPTYEWSNTAVADQRHVEIFKKFKHLQTAGLLRTKAGEKDRDLYFTAERSGHVRLTPLGQFYWKLARDGRI